MSFQQIINKIISLLLTTLAKTKKLNMGPFRSIFEPETIWDHYRILNHRPLQSIVYSVQTTHYYSFLHSHTINSLCFGECA